ncbi:MAG: (2Fe-2S) ferredoxin domain-containing protein [Turicibacter sp.]
MSYTRQTYRLPHIKKEDEGVVTDMKTLQELEQIREKTLKNLQVRNHENNQTRLVVGMGTCGISAGARSVLSALVDEINARHLEGVSVIQTGCIGMCTLEPMFDVYHQGEKTTYVHMTPEKAKRVVLEHLVNGQVIQEFAIGAYIK